MSTDSPLLACTLRCANRPRRAVKHGTEQLRGAKRQSGIDLELMLDGVCVCVCASAFTAIIYNSY